MIPPPCKEPPPSEPGFRFLVGVASFTGCLNGFVGETIPGGLLKLKIEEPPGAVGVVGRPGDAETRKVAINEVKLKGLKSDSFQISFPTYCLYNSLTSRSHEESRRRWDEDRIHCHHMVAQSGCVRCECGVAVAVVIVPVSGICTGMDVHEGGVVLTVVRRHGVGGVRRSLAVHCASHLHERHGYRVEVRATSPSDGCGSQGLRLVDIWWVVKLVLNLLVRVEPVMHFRREGEI